MNREPYPAAAGKLLRRVILPLALGAGLYLLLRPEAFLSRGVYALLGAAPAPAAGGGLILKLARNHLADMLWAWALTCCASLVLGRGRAVASALTAIGTGLFVELAQQALGVGTFDWLDLALEALAAVAAGLWITRAERREAQ